MAGKTRAKFTVIVMIVALGWIFSSAGYSFEKPSHSDMISGTQRLPDPSDFAQSTMLVLFTVKNGKIDKSVYPVADLLKSPEISVDGYVAGIVALSETELTVSLNGKRMRKVKQRKDGTLFFDYFGKLNPTDIFVFGMADNRDFEQETINLYFEDHDVQGYSYFPKITGDAVSPDDRFDIDILKNGKRLELAVYQKGYRNLPTKGFHRFRYVGDLDAVIGPQDSDVVKRLEAISDGIAEVERAFEVNLVRNVNIVDCKGIHNALTRDGYDDIWFFVETFQQEPIAELKTISTHEVLHLLVQRFDLTQSPAIREIFADLKQLDELSFERFCLMTRGIMKYPTSSNDDHVFFSFINEKNYFDGCKGGHSQDNLDEFCTSFLHTLLYSERIPENLHRRCIEADRPVRDLSSGEKDEILSYYERVIASLIESVGGKSMDFESFLEANLAYIGDLHM